MKHSLQEPPQSAAPHVPIVYVRENTVWEYKLLVADSGDGAEAERKLNALGAEGWELAGVAVHRDSVRFWFKRPKSG